MYHSNTIHNTMPYMKCESCGVVIECDDMSEAEQRGRIHMQEVKTHKATWMLEDVTNNDSESKYEGAE
jgi:hypothetical protein